MSPDGTRERRLTSGPADDRDAAWSPDGRRIAFTRRRNGNWDVYVMRADGSGVRRLTPSGSALAEDEPAWSPDGSALVFGTLRFRDVTGPDYAVTILPAAGGTSRKIVGCSDTYYASPSWLSMP
jgi:TolB protein